MISFAYGQLVGIYKRFVRCNVSRIQVYQIGAARDATIVQVRLRRRR